MVSLEFKTIDDDDGNENTTCKAWHVIHYTHQWLNRRCKALIPENKLEEAELYSIEKKRQGHLSIKTLFIGLMDSYIFV